MMLRKILFGGGISLALAIAVAYSWLNCWFMALPAAMRQKNYCLLKLICEPSLFHCSVSMALTFSPELICATPAALLNEKNAAYRQMPEAV